MKQEIRQNETHEVSISIIVMQKFTPLMAHIMEDMKAGAPEGIIGWIDAPSLELTMLYL